jgi:hypothetical protein
MSRPPKHEAPARQPDPAILEIARALARQAAREDHAAELADAEWRAKAAPSRGWRLSDKSDSIVRGLDNPD